MLVSRTRSTLYIFRLQALEWQAQNSNFQVLVICLVLNCKCTTVSS